MDLTREQLLALRAHAQGLSAPIEGGPEGVVRRFGALQGQDFRAVRTAIALRSGASEATVAEAFRDGTIVRGWPMRGTLFATTPLHLASLLALTSERIHRAAARRRTELGITDAVLSRATEVAEEALASGPLTRRALSALWAEAGLPTAGGATYHLILDLSIAGRCHWGTTLDGEPALVATPPPGPLLELPAIVEGYLRSHGPASVEDVCWWLKLPKGMVRSALAEIETVEVGLDGRPYVVLPETLDASPTPLGPEHVWRLPAFDEWFLGYQDRSPVADPDVIASVTPGNNGVFRPLVVEAGRVTGTWSR
ncbi:winged helix DNA-binding domain-containing protein [Nocardioides montaniterrae]